MKKILSVVFAFVLVLAMSVPAFAVSAPDVIDDFTPVDAFAANTVVDDNTFSPVTEFDISNRTFSAEQISNLKEWVNSDSNVLFYIYHRPSDTYTLFFIIAPTSSNFTYTIVEKTLYVFCSENSSVFSHVQYTGSGGNGFSVIRPPNPVVSHFSTSFSFVSGTYFENAENPLSPEIAKLLDYNSFTIKDKYGIFDGWKSSLGSPPVQYDISVDYKYDNGVEAAPPVSGKYLVGDAYSFVSPVIDGYTPDISMVSGTVLDTFAPVTDYHVVYRETPCKLTINYLYEDGTQAAPSFVGHYGRGDGYNVLSPDLAGYLPKYPIIRGTVPTFGNADMVHNVVYRVDRSLITASDFGPLTSGLIKMVSAVFVSCCSVWVFFLSVKCVVELLLSMTR